MQSLMAGITKTVQEAAGKSVGWVRLRREWMAGCAGDRGRS